MLRLVPAVLCLLPVLARAEVVRFYLPAIPGIYEERHGKPGGLYVDLLQQMASEAGVTLSLYIASRPRIQQSMLSQSDACSAVTLPERLAPPEGMQYVYQMGQTQAQLFSRPGDRLTLPALASVPLAQRMVFGEGVASMLTLHGMAVPQRSQSLQQAVAMLQAQRIRVLFATRAALSRLPPGTLEPGPELGALVSWFTCSTRMQPAVVQRLASAWQRVPLPRF